MSIGNILNVGEDGRSKGFDIFAEDRIIKIDIIILIGDIFFFFNFGFKENVGIADKLILFDLRGAVNRQGGEDNPIELDGLLRLDKHRRKIDLRPLPGYKFAYGSVIAGGYIKEKDVLKETATARRAALS